MDHLYPMFQHWTHVSDVMMVFTRCLCPSALHPIVQSMSSSLSSVSVTSLCHCGELWSLSSSQQQTNSDNSLYLHNINCLECPESPCAPLAHWRLHWPGMAIITRSHSPSTRGSARRGILLGDKRTFFMWQMLFLRKFGKSTDHHHIPILKTNQLHSWDWYCYFRIG